MVKIYLLRHCETMNNELGTYYVQGDVTRFSSRGEKQLIAVKKYFKNIDIKDVYCSSANRCIETASQVSSVLTSLKILEDQDVGDFGGQTRDNLAKKYPDFYLRRKENMYETKYPNGESFKDVEERIVNWFEKQDFTRDTLIVTHASCILLLLKYFNKWDFKTAKNLFIAPASLSIIEYHSQSFNVVEAGKDLLSFDYSNLKAKMSKVV